MADLMGILFWAWFCLSAVVVAWALVELVMGRS